MERRICHRDTEKVKKDGNEKSWLREDVPEAHTEKRDSSLRSE
jgi:hypothetical protein